HRSLHSFPTRRSSDLKIEQLVLVGGQPEEIAFFRDPLHRRAERAITLTVIGELGLALVVIGFVADRVPAGIFVEIDVAVGLHLRSEEHTSELQSPYDL